MTPAERLRKEEAEITARVGYYIPPFRMAGIMRAAQKITELLLKGDVCVTYAECRTVLRVVDRAIADVTGGETDG